MNIRTRPVSEVMQTQVFSLAVAGRLRSEGRAGRISPMPESNQALRHTLAELRQQLDAATEVDAAARAELEAAMQHVQQQLDGGGEEGARPDIQGSFVERLSQAAEEFEGSHPRLTAALGRVLNALADLGI